MEEKPREFATITDAIVAKSIAYAAGVHVSDVQLISFEESEGSVLGTDNFTAKVSAIAAKADVNGSAVEFDFMAKSAEVGEFKVSDLEVDFYTEILPVLKTYDPDLSVPNFHYASKLDGVVVMENLKKADYVPAMKIKDLSRDQVLITLALLARFHAATYHFFRKKFSGDASKLEIAYPGISRSCWLRSDLTTDVEGWMARIHATTCKVLKEDEGHEQSNEILQKLEKMDGKEFTARAVRDMAAKEGAFNVIAHNDAWKSNFMYRSSESVQLLDFVEIRVASPTWDLLHFLTTSVLPPENLKKDVDEFLRHYHKTLADRLSSYGYNDVYPFEALKTDFESKSTFAFCFSFMHNATGLSDFFDADDCDEAELAEWEKKVLTAEARSIVLQLARDAFDAGDFA